MAPKRAAKAKEPAAKAKAASAALAAPPPADIDEDAPLAALASDQESDDAPEAATGTGGRPRASKGPARDRTKDENRRQRFVPPNECELVREAVDGFMMDIEDDPSQSGTCADRESAEVRKLWQKDPQLPVSKQNRHKYVWVVRARPHKGDARATYTWNPDRMHPMRNFVLKEDNTCDVCGASCKETLYEFRCYSRFERTSDMDAIRESLNRRLHPCRAFISKECGSKLLGVQSDASKLLEQIAAIVRGENPEQHLRELWAAAPERMRRLIQDKLRFLARQEEGESAVELEFKKAEEHFKQELFPKGEDPFRAVARSLQSISHWALAAFTLQHIARNMSEPLPKGWLGQVVNALREKQPLPNAPTPLPPDEATAALRLLAEAVPLRLHLKDMLREPQVFEPKKAAVADVVLVYVCGATHALADGRIEKVVAQELRETMMEEVRQCKEEFAPLEQIMRHTFSRKEDAQIQLPDGKVDPQYIRHVLEDIITWPPCFSRNNVKPDMAPFINAFPMGMVLNYHTGLMASRTLRIWPTLAKLLNRFRLEAEASFKYTTIQLNKNYAAKMHVDGNNHGPSRIIALGDFTGGELWVYDGRGDHEMEVPDKMKGWPDLRPGSKVKGSLHCIKNEWFAFDGTVPHAVLPYEGVRFSIVFFTRRNYLDMKHEARLELMSHDFPFPGEEWESQAGLAKGTIQAEHSTDGTKRRKVEAAAEDGEIDEEEEMDAALLAADEQPQWKAKDWAAEFRKRLGASTWGPASVGRPLGISVSCTNLGPILAAEQFLPPGKLNVISMTDTAFAAPNLGRAALNFVRLNCRPRHLFIDLAAPAAGAGHCEIQHMDVTMPPKEEEDIFVGTFRAAPLLNRSTSGLKSQHNYFNDPNIVPFKEQRNHIQKRQPPVALLLVADFEELPKRQRNEVLAFVLHGVGPDDAPFGLADAGPYGMEVAELAFQEFGTPQAQRSVLIIMVRKDRGGQGAAARIAGLLRLLAGSLPRTYLQELLFRDDDQRLKHIQRRFWKRSAKPKDPKGTSAKVLIQEMRELGANAGPETPYVSNTLEAEFGGKEQVAQEWFPHASDTQRLHVSVAHERAMKCGMAVESLVLNLWAGVSAKERVWRDDGLLTSKPGMHYAYSRHRPITGQEEMLLRGYNISRLRFASVSDLDLIALSGSSISYATPVPAIGAALFCALITVDLGDDRRLKLEEAALSALLAKAAPVDEKTLTAAVLREEALMAKPESSGEAGFEGRAAALLNLVNHGGFVASSGAAAGATVGDETKKVLATLEKVAEVEGDEPEQHEQLLAKPAPGSEAAAKTADEDTEWSIRLRRLKAGPTGAKPPSVDLAVKYMRDAADDHFHAESEKIIMAGIAYLNALDYHKKAGGKSKSEALRGAGFAELEQSLRNAGLLEDETGAVAAWVSEISLALFEADLSRPGSATALTSHTNDNMKEYVESFVDSLDDFGRRRTFIDHLCNCANAGTAGFMQSDGAKMAFGAFFNHGGFLRVAKFFKEAPAHFEQSWPRAEAALETFSRLESRLKVNVPELAAAICFAGARCRSKRLPAYEERIAVLGAAALTADRDVERALEALSTLLECGHRAALRLEGTRVILDRLRNAQTMGAADGESVVAWRFHLQKLRDAIHSANAEARFVGGKWEEYAIAEKVMINDFPQVLERKMADVEEKQRQEELMRRQREEQRRREEMLLRMQELKQQKIIEAEAGSAKLRALLDGDRLRSSGDDEQDLANLHLELAAFMQNTPEDVRQASPALQALVSTALEAARHVQERPEAVAIAGRWLQSCGMGYCLPLLRSRGVLERLGDFGSLGAGLFRNIGLPNHIADKLAHQASLTNFDGDFFRPPADSQPQGWIRSVSTKSRMAYFQEARAMPGQTNRRQWMWPAALDVKVPKLPEPPALENVGKPQEEASVFIDIDVAGNMHCRLCSTQGWPHLVDDLHHEGLTVWNKLVEALEETTSELRERLSLGSEESPGLLEVWRRELRRRLSETASACSRPPRALGRRAEQIFVLRVCNILDDGRGGRVAPNASPAALRSLFEDMLVLSTLPEPVERVLPPEPLPYYPAPPGKAMAEIVDQNSSMEPLSRLTAEDFVGEGLQLTPAGKWRCRVCDTTVEEIDKHLHPFYKSARSHRTYRDVARDCAAQLRKMGWRLRHHGVSIKDNMFRCTVCQKKGPWYELFGEAGHLQGKNHKGQKVPAEPTEQEEEAWSSAFAKADEELEGLLQDEAYAAAATEAVKRLSLGSVPAAAAPVVAAVPVAKVAPPSPDIAEEDEGIDLPTPGVHFPCFPPGSVDVSEGMTDAQVEQLGELALLGEGVVKRDGGWYCDVCEWKLPSVAKHLGPTKEGKGHAKNKAIVVEAVARLAGDGWALRYEGVQLMPNRTFHCRLCQKEEGWYNVFDHMPTKRHQQQRQWSAELKKKPPSGTPAAVQQRDAWKTMIEEHKRAAAAAAGGGPPSAPPAAAAPTAEPTPSASSAAPRTGSAAMRARLGAPAPALRGSAAAGGGASAPAAPQDAAPPAAKRAKVAEAGEGSVGAGGATASSSSSSGRVRMPYGMDIVPNPSPADFTETVQKVGSWYPDLRKPLAYGKYIKKKGACIWCSACKSWVGWATVNCKGNTLGVLETDDDGECPHYSVEEKARMRLAYDNTVGRRK